jgi:hypothetical protein
VAAQKPGRTVVVTVVAVAGVTAVALRLVQKRGHLSTMLNDG